MGNGRKSQNFGLEANLDTDQWIKTLKDAGFKRTIMVVKLTMTDLSSILLNIQNIPAASPWKNGKGDLLEEISNQQLIMKRGGTYHIGMQAIKLSREYWKRVQRILLTNSRKSLVILNTEITVVVEVWMDGAW